MRIRAVLIALLMAPAMAMIGLASPASASMSRLATAAAPQGSCRAGTSFNPPVPNGAPMDQTYVNCSGVVTVCPVIIIAGIYHVDTRARQLMGPGTMVTWHYYVTEPGTSYSTAFCPAIPITVEGNAAARCNTNFYPPKPVTAPMDQSYGNCSNSDVEVLPAYWLNGSLYVDCWGYLMDPTLNLAWPTVLPAHQSVWWYWSSTILAASYTTVFADNFGVYDWTYTAI